MLKTAASRAELESIARRWISLWQTPDMRLVDELHDPEFVDRSPDGRGQDLPSFKTGILDLYAAFPDFIAETRLMVVDELDSSVAISWIAAGTHEASFMGYPASHAQIRFSGIEIIRIRNGKIIERWGEWNGAGIVSQLEEAARIGDEAPKR